MSEQWTKWEGQTIDDKFPLRRFLASTDHSAVYLTELSEPQPQKAVIKLIPGFPSAETQLALWKRAAHLSHPHLLTLYQCGRCRLGDSNLLYVVMEHAEENLAEILPQRALAPDESRDFLEPALDVLVYLHAKGLAHGHLKPSNLLATQDCLKLSSDSLLSIGAVVELHRALDIYDPPELPTAPVSAKGDVWSLGATLVEALTQKPPVLAAAQSADPAIPDALPELFREIARHCLRRQVNARWSVGDIAARLNPAPLAAAAVAAAGTVANLSPLSVPLSSEPAVPLAKLPSAAEPSIRRDAPRAKGRTGSPLDYFVPALLGAAVLIGLIFALPKIFNFPGQSASPAASATTEPRAAAKPEETFGPKTAAIAPERPITKSPAKESPNPPLDSKTETPTLAPAPVILRTDSGVPKAKEANEIEGRGQVLDQVLPKPASKAMATIQGTIRVLVKVQVDPAGNVINSELDAPGPSKYFAGLAEKAARQWQFAGAETDGHGVPSEWLIRFEFSSSGVHASAHQNTP